MPKKKRKTYTDETKMEWGAHKGKAMKDVPADYLLWLFRQDWIKDWPDLYDYLVRNQEALLLEEGEEQRKNSGAFESLDDYMRNG